MRRSACFLTIVGLSLNSVAAQDVFGPSAVRPTRSGTSLQYFSSGKNASSSTSQKINQLKPATPTAEAAPTAPAAQTPNYYSELFGNAQPAESDSRTRLKPVITPKPTQEVEPNSTPDLGRITLDTDVSQGRVIQAAFQTEPAEKSQIQQVRAERPTARPFPGKMQSAPQPEAAKTSLTNPIAVGTPAPKVEATLSTESNAPKAGNVTFSQGRTRPTALAPTAPVAPSAPTVPTVVTNQEAGPQTPSVTIEWKQQSAINVGQECECDLVVKNTGSTDASGVEVEAFFPKNVRLLDASPRPTKSETFLGWQFASIKAGEERVIKVKMQPLERGSIETRANVRFTGSANGMFVVAEPMLAVKVRGPETVMIGDSAPHTVVITNPGNGIASNVQIEALIPDGLEHARGKRLLMEIGSLNPGESRNIRLAMAAVTGGEHQIQVQARADAGLIQRTVAEVSVIAPSLNAEIDGPGLRYLGRQGVFTLSVANDGAAATSNVQVMHKIPDGFEFVGADKGVQFDRASRLMTWFVGRLEKGEQSEIKVTLTAKKIGEHKHLVRATSEHGSLSDAEFTSRVDGTSSLSVEVVDLDDPVEIGTEAIYEVRVKNEGSAAAKDVGLACELAPGVGFVTATGPSQNIAENQNVVFRTIPELGPGKTAVYRIHVKSQTNGNTRFRARVTSESVAEPLTADELTKFYGE